uniref:MFS domain-containing protein n=1 Tax=Macrostomum lignano TaxID=282301 RepID=A0A1I8JBJ5_9PLAT
MLGLAGLPALLQILCFAWLPESPRWLVARERLGAARTVLERLRGVAGSSDAESDVVDVELKEIVAKHREEMRVMADRGPRPILLQMLEQPWTRRALLIGCGLQAFQQLSGINTVMYYSASIVKMAGVRDDAMAVWLSAATAGTNFFACFIGLSLVERIGRRPLLIGSLCGVIASLAVLAVGFQIIRDNSMPVAFPSPLQNNTRQCFVQSTCDSCISQHPTSSKLDSIVSCGFCYSGSNGTCVSVSRSGNSSLCPATSQTSSWFLAKDFCPTPYAWIVLTGLITYLAFFSPGMAPVPWLINSEIYPLWGRSAGSGLATCVNWTCNLLVSLTFLSLTELLTKHGTYWLFASLATLALLFVIKFVPETKGKSLEEIEFMLENNI